MAVARSDDLDIAYDVTGEGDPLLLIMGLGMDATAWALQVPVFGERYRVVTFDNRGAGRSAGPPGPYTTEQMADDALAVLDAAGAERTHIVGVSLGGAVAQWLALRAPDRVRSLVLVSTWARPSAWRSRLRAVQLELAGVSRDALLRLRLHLVFSPLLFEQKPELIDLIERSMTDRGAPLEGYLAQLDAAETHDARARLPDIGVPTLGLAGRRDILVPPELTKEIASAIPGARLELFETAHAIQFEEVERFNRVVLDFLSTQT